MFNCWREEKSAEHRLRVGRVSAKNPTSRKEREKWGTRLTCAGRSFNLDEFLAFNCRNTPSCQEVPSTVEYHVVFVVFELSQCSVQIAALRRFQPTGELGGGRPQVCAVIEQQEYPLARTKRGAKCLQELTKLLDRWNSSNGDCLNKGERLIRGYSARKPNELCKHPVKRGRYK